MNNEDNVNQYSSNKSYSDKRGGATLYSHPIIGIVKNNIDPIRSGRIQVYLKRQNSTNQDNPAFWTTVSYMSPFFGYTPNTGSSDSAGSYVGNPNSYGFWATPPDIGTEVLCIFVNGDPNFGFYIGGIPKEAMLHMVPAIGASDNVIPNEGESTAYGGATRLPVTEYNDANTGQDNNTSSGQNPRPIHSYQAAILNKQGLLRDRDRGAIGSSSMRESPSRVFGMSTPGRPIYDGGYNDETITDAIKNEQTPATNYKVIGRTGGHSIVMDDGDLQGRDQLVRMRTSSGHMILMNDFAQTLFIIHANGSSYIELGKEGTIDMYSTNSVNIRTQGDLNLHADNNINIQATKDLNISAKNIHMESIEETTQFTGKNFKQYTEGDHTLKVDKKMSFSSAGDSMIKSGGTNYQVGGPNVHLNTGESSLVPEKVKQIPITVHTDTLRDNEKGYIAAPGKLPSIVSRAPAHMPWLNSNQGVDVKTDLSASAGLPSDPSPAVEEANNSVASEKITPTNPSMVSTVPTPASSGNGQETPGSTAAVISQAAINVSTGPAAEAIAKKTGVVDVEGVKTAAIGKLALTPSQLAEEGTIKPGSDVMVNKLIAEGKSLEKAMPANIFTGKAGVKSVADLANSTKAQAGVMNNLLQSGQKALQTTGVLTGKESFTQTAGLSLSVATNGLNNTLGSLGPLSKVATTGIMAVGISKVLSPFGKSPAGAVASGLLAAKLADTVMGPLSGADVGANLKGAASGMFDKIKSTFVNLKPNTPQRLTGPVDPKAAAESSENQAADLGTSASNAANSVASTVKSSLANTASSALSGVTGAIRSVVGGVTSAISSTVSSVVSGVKNAFNSLTGTKLPGGLGSISNVVSGSSGASSASLVLGKLTTEIKNITGSISSSLSNITGKVAGLKNSMSKPGDLKSSVSSGLPKDLQADLQGAISSLGGGGAIEVKAPTIAVDTNVLGGLVEQSKKLLGNPKIPPLNLGTITIPAQPLSEENVKKYDELKKRLDLLEDQKFDKRRAYLDAIREFGATAEQTITAKSDYEATIKEIESLQIQLRDIALG